ncbi:transposase [Bradyrhizobium sp. CCBAU 53421]|uniref:transposase n=1 Tax=Bradyrhizobium sp. CCBAU 53421 TaxID=1325120 RepID=UPI001FEF740C|nr:transposase [Bradyrhizobium sp. CCBAU 53421]
MHSAITEPVRRLEVFTGAGRRLELSDEDKARIVAEIVASGDSVCSVARRHGLSPQQLFGWRRQLREAAGGHSEADKVQFVPAVVEAVVPAPAAHQERKVVRKDRDRSRRHHDPGRSWCGPNDDCVDRPGAEGEPVVGPSGAVRVMVATKPVDFRNYA